jgi:urease accessory protein
MWTGDPAATVTLAFDDRHRRRIRLSDDSGGDFLLNLADAVLLSDGDGLLLDDGGIIAVRAAEEPVADIQCRDVAHGVRVAWHIGNRHTAIQVLDGGRLRISDDHVLVAMAEGLGARVLRHAAPFQPEPGAYASTQGNDHDHDHDHG